jgi:amino acid transporter
MGEVPSGKGLIRALGPAMATAVVVGTVIGSGIFKKPQVIAQNVEYFGITAGVWVLGGVLALLGALSLAEVAVRYPRAGGNYVFLREAYGRMMGFLSGWVDFCIIRAASIAALATVFSQSLNNLLGNPLGYWPLHGLTIGAILILAAINAVGVRWGGGVQLAITIIKVCSLVGIFLLPFLVAAFASSDTDVRHPDTARLAPWWPEHWSVLDWTKVGVAFLGVLWAYHGWMNVAPLAEEVRRPERNLPLALIAGVGIVIVLYLGANLAYALILSRTELMRLDDPPVVTGFSQKLLGQAGTAVASAIVMCSVLGALNGNLLVGPRLLYAMGEDRLLPTALGRAHPRFHTPVLATFILAAWSCLLVLGVALLLTIVQMKDSPFDVLTNHAMFGAVIFETLAVVSIFVFRRRERLAGGPPSKGYRCWGYPVVPALYVVLPALILVSMIVQEPLQAGIGAAVVGVGAGVYLLRQWSVASDQ